MPAVLKSDSRILVTGASGMVGARFATRLKASHKNLFAPTRKECDLEDRTQTQKVFADFKPEFVFHLAGKVGGIQANINDPVGFLSSNVLMAVHTLEAAHKTQVKKFLFMGSSCIYPRECPQPMREEFLLTGPLEPTNEGYALAKIAGLKLAAYYHQQHRMNVVCPVPSNIYGPGDTFDFDRAHVLSSLVRRFADAKASNAKSLQLWGTGQARREFIHVDDVIEACLFLMENHSGPGLINVGTGHDLSINELARMIADKVGFRGEITWDPSKPSGMPRKVTDISKLTKLGFKSKVTLDDGIAQVVADYGSRRAKGEWQ